MFVLQIDEFMKHSGCDWIETRCLCVSESREKLQELSDKIKEESLEYYKVEREIIYTRDLSNEVKHEMMMTAHRSFKHLSEYQVFREIDDYENKLSIVEIKVI